MFWRKILFLAAGYVAGNVVASVYGTTKKKTKSKQWKEDLKLMIENFLDTQKNMVSDIEKKYISDENKKKLEEKKEQFSKYSQQYIKQGEKLLEEISKSEKFLEGKKKANWVLNWLKKSLSEIKKSSK